MLNGRVLPFLAGRDIPLCRLLTNRDLEYCGMPERREYESYLALQDIDHSKTKAKSPQAKSICERIQKTVLDELYSAESCGKLYTTPGRCRTTWTHGVKSTTGGAATRGAGVTVRQRVDNVALAKKEFVAA